MGISTEVSRGIWLLLPQRLGIQFSLDDKFIIYHTGKTFVVRATASQELLHSVEVINNIFFAQRLFFCLHGNHITPNHLDTKLLCS
jgi:hypothetical protein